MIAWFSKRVSWTRRTRWTPLLQNQREFQRTLTKERSRVDRSGNCFGFIILRLTDLDDARSQTVQLAKLLHRRLRETDEKGHLGYGRLGVMLPETHSDDTDFVLNDIIKMAGDRNLKIDGESFVYPDQTTPNNESDTQDSETLTPGAPTEPLAEDPVAMEASQNSAALRKLNDSPLAMMLPSYPRWKRLIDVVCAVFGLVIGAPLLLLVAFAVRLTSRGPVLFCQPRTGYLGRTFTMFKFRTMVVNAEALKMDLQESNERDGPAFKMKRDPRITSVGRFLRATGLDELPQLLNVLFGDMSIVGPRPLPVDEAAQCARWQKRRQEVKPGLTCFWQLAKSRNVSFADWMRLDLKYAKKTSFTLDVKLILRTFSSVLLGRVGH